MVVAVVLALTLAPPAEAFIYWTDTSLDAIGRGNVDGTGVNQSFISGAEEPTGLAIDAGHIYWTNRTADTIGRANLDGTGVNQNFIVNLANPSGLAVDGAHIYWGNATPSFKSIGRANIDGSGADPEFITGPGATTLEWPAFGVAVNGTHIYWTVSALGGPISRANIDGGSPSYSFIPSNGPTALALDTAHVYWTTFFDDGIGRANLSGTGSTPFGSGGTPMGIAVDDAHVYWGNTDDGTIGRSNLNGSGVDQSFMSAASAGSPPSLAIDALAVPSCQGTSVSTGHAEPVAVSLPCTSGGGVPTFSIASGPAHGTISGLNSSAGTLTYTPATGFNGTDSFEFQVRNPGAASNAATATIGVAKASNEFTIGAAKKNAKKGTAILPVSVPGAGAVALAGKTVRAEEVQAGGAGEVRLPVKATGKAKKTLKRKGKVKVALHVTFTPLGGDASTVGTSVKLKRKK
jgi:stage V sporulation protein SpoVS